MAYLDLTTVAAVNAWLSLDPTQAGPAGQDSATIQSAITGYSRYVHTRTGRAYLGGIRTYTERYDGNGSNRLMLRNYPVLSVASLTVGPWTILQTPDYIQQGFAIDASGSQCSVVLAGETSRGPWAQSGMTFPEGVQNIAITYTAGYLLEMVGEAQTVGSDLTVTAEMKSWYRDVGVTDQDGNAVPYTVSDGVYTFQQAGDVLLSYQYGGVPEDLAQAVTEIVAGNYRRRGWIDQASQTQPGVGTTAFRSWEMSPQNQAVIDRYRMRFLA